MKYLLIVILLFSCNQKQAVKPQTSADEQKVNCKACKDSITPYPAHIIVVFMENHSYDDIIGNADASYINLLADSGTLFTNFHGITHPSQGNYVGFFSGDMQGITNDDCLTQKISAPNLYSKLSKAGKTFCWYSEDLPADGSTISKSGYYVRKHNASSDFINVPDSCNKMFSEFPIDYNTLPNLVIISPNVKNDMHSGTIKQADDWVKNNLGSLADWCKINNSIFFVTTDEDDRATNNHIFTTAYGENVLSNNVVSDSLDHYNMTKTISSLLGVSTTWTNNLQNRKIIKIFK